MIYFNKNFQFGLNDNKSSLSLHLDVSQGATIEIINASLKKIVNINKCHYENINMILNNILMSIDDSVLHVSLDNIIDIIYLSKIHIQYKSLLIRILKVLRLHLYTVTYKILFFNKYMIFKMLYYMIDFICLIYKINPMVISCTKIPLSLYIKQTSYDNDFYKKVWILSIVKDVPTVDYDVSYCCCDVVGVGVLISVCSYFGSRGQGVVRMVALGEKKDSYLKCISIVYVADDIIRNVFTKNTGILNIEKLLKIEIIISKVYIDKKLLYLIKRMGGIKIFYYYIFYINGEKLLLNVYVSNFYFFKIIKILFFFTEIESIYYYVVEEEKIYKKHITIPYQYNKIIMPCRITEWYFSNNIIKLEPNYYDLNIIVKHSGIHIKKVYKQLIKFWYIFKNM